MAAEYTRRVISEIRDDLTPRHRWPHPWKVDSNDLGEVTDESLCPVGSSTSGLFERVRHQLYRECWAGPRATIPTTRLGRYMGGLTITPTGARAR
jgi:hypothetical protein